MTTTTSPPDDGDEIQGPAAYHARRFGKPMPTTAIPNGPAEWHQHFYPRETR